MYADFFEVKTYMTYSFHMKVWFDLFTVFRTGTPRDTGTRLVCQGPRPSLGTTVRAKGPLMGRVGHSAAAAVLLRTARVDTADAAEKKRMFSVFWLLGLLNEFGL